MRLFLLPLSTRRTLLYCQRLHLASTEKQGWLDKGRLKAVDLWASWEKKESGWQKKLVDYGNQALKRIPYEEWGLKTIPPISERRRAEELSAKGPVEVHFPPTLIPEEKVLDLLKTLGTERQGLHKKRMIWSIVGMPIVAPFALVPVIPNIPFFYLAFRAWSHWAALSGSKHVEFLLDNKLITTKPSQILDELYAAGKKTSDADTTSSDQSPANEEKMVLHKSETKPFAEALGIPELHIELERAVWQVEKALRAEKELKEEKTELDSVQAKSKEKK